MGINSLLRAYRNSPHSHSTSYHTLRDQVRSRAPVSNITTVHHFTTVAYQAEAEAYAASTPSNPTASSSTALPTMDMNKFASSFQSFGKTVSSSVSPFAQRSQQWIREQTGSSVGEKTELPHDYIELE